MIRSSGGSLAWATVSRDLIAWISAVTQLGQHALEQQAAPQHRWRTVAQAVTIEHPEPDNLGPAGKLLPGQVHVLRWDRHLVDVREMSFDGGARVHIACGDVEAREEALDDACGRIALAKSRVAPRESSQVRSARTPTRLKS